MQPNVGMVGLGTMGANLARNIESRGYPIGVYNRTASVTAEFMKSHGPGKFVASETLPDFVKSLQRPRQIIILVKAGAATDAVIDQLLPLVDKDDIIIDGGNAYFTDTQRRDAACREKGVLFMGLGVSGGEEGALRGPSLMPGGPNRAWEIMSEMLIAISAKAPEPCVTYIGPDGAGHFVKMVHNGIEYGDMQLIAEAYDLLRVLARFTPPELGDVFERWNRGVLESFLIEITAKIFRRKDELSGGYLVDQVLDRAEQKGTGKWTAQVALDLGVAVPTIGAAVNARILSSLKKEREAAAETFAAKSAQISEIDRTDFVQVVHDALYCAKILSYAQGMALMSAASKEHKWDLKLGEIAKIWKGGCIIRARFLDVIASAYAREPGLRNLILNSDLKRDLETRIAQLRRVTALAAESGVPVPGFANSLAYFDSYTRAELPQNLTQAQRDCFGAHTYERRDREGTFHSEW